MKSGNIILAIHFCCLFSCLCQGQESLHRLHLLNGEKGLSQTSNGFIFKDSRGYVWVSSIDGLNIYNGSSVRVFKQDKSNRNFMGDANVQSPFFEDTVGNIWFTTVSSLNCFQRRQGAFQHYFLGKKAPAGLTNNYVFHLEQGRYLWTISNDHLYKFDTKEPDSTDLLHPLTAGRCAVQTTPEGKVKRLFACYWALGYGFEMISYDLQGDIIAQDTFFAKTNIPAPYALILSQVAVENDTLAWFATDKGLLSFNPSYPDRYQLFSVPRGSGGIRDIYLQEGKRLWVIAEDGAIMSFDKGKFSAPLEGAGKRILTDARAMLIDKDQTLWYSVSGEGVFFSKIGRRRFYHPLSWNNHPKVEITGIFEDNRGNVFCAGRRGDSYIVSAGSGGATPVHFPARSKFFQDQQGKIWNISSEGLGYWDDKSGKVINLVPGNGLRFNDITGYANDYLIVGTSQKTIRISKKDYSVRIVPSMPEGVMSLCYDRFNRLWAGGINEDLSAWDIRPNDNPVLVRRIPNSGLVHHLAEDTLSDCIWAATANGLLRINLNSWYDTLLTELDGLPNQYIYAVIPDRNRNIWLSTNGGIIKYTPHMSGRQQFKQYTVRDGLTANEYCRGAGLLSSTGEIWFGSTHGIDVFHPDSVRDIGSAPQLAIVGLKIHDQDWRNDTVCIEMAQRIELEYDQNTLRLEMAALEYTDPEMNKFKVRLVKDTTFADSLWVDLGTQNFITYANLLPGRYFFQFTACNAESIWQKTPRTLEIIVNPHFTQTWWFQSLMAALALALIGFGTAFYYRYRLRAQQLELEKQQREADRKQLLLENELALQHERNRIADEMHDELGGGLSTIRLASERAKKMKSPEELQSILSRVSQISIGLVSNMRGIIWAMDTQNDSLTSLLAYIRQYARTFLDDNALEADIKMPAEYPDLSLSGQYRHNVMLTVKECLNNILKHAEASVVQLQVSVGDELSIVIRDNGKGFDPGERLGAGKGLRTTLKRMESVGGSIEWSRNEEGGMMAFLRAPLPKST